MSVEERLERLERQNKWMRRLGAVGVALVAVVFLMGQGKEPPDLVVRALTLKDAAGKTRAELGVRDGAPILTLKDEAGRPRVALSQEIMEFFDSSGPRVSLGMYVVRFVRRGRIVTVSDGRPLISLYDKAHKPRIFLTVDEDGSPYLRTMDPDGEIRATLGVTHTANKITGAETKTAANT